MSKQVVAKSRKEALAKGLPLYMGNRCKNGNTAPRLTSNGVCQCQACKEAKAVRDAKRWANYYPRRKAALAAQAEGGAV